MQTETLKQYRDDAQFILVGIGEEWKEHGDPDRLEKACAGLKGLLEGKEYFVVTTLEDPKPLEAAAEESRIAAPFSGEAVPAGTEERWQASMKWLMGTLNRTLLLLELGVGFQAPGVIRWPFEKTAALNQKALLCRVHEKFYQLPDNLEGRGISIKTDSTGWMAAMEDIWH